MLCTLYNDKSAVYMDQQIIPSNQSNMSVYYPSSAWKIVSLMSLKSLRPFTHPPATKTEVLTKIFSQYSKPRDSRLLNKSFRLASWNSWY